MTPSILTSRAPFPEALEFLFKKAPYKVCYGGRGASKSWNFARAVLIRGTEQKLRILCARETMKSIRDSVHQLLEEQIKMLGLEPFYRIEKSVIYGSNGTEILFAGLKANVDNIKSMEAIDICWVEEGQVVPKASWDKLIPTLFRVPNCELWVSFNPDLESDDTYQRFVVNPPEGAIVQKLTFRDNPWFPSGLMQQLVEARRRNIDEYNHIWEGSCINTLANAIYANELRLVDTEGRIKRVPYDPSKPVDTAWDLGYGDMVSIWMWQSFPMEFRIIDYEEGVRQPINYYISELQKRPYVWGTDYLPWDGGLKHLGTGKSIEELMRAVGRRVKVAPRLPIFDGINAARTIFPLCWFDADRCADGLRSLRMYRYGELQSVDGPTREPLHDMHCLVPDTLVLTRYGTCRIIDLPENGEVLTPCGWKAYEAPRITRRNAQLVEVRFKDGTTVRCTPDHLFLTGNGWRSAESLTPNTWIQSSLTRSRSISMGVYIAYGRVNAIFRTVRDSIATFGKTLSALFQKAAIYTIAIPIRPITLSQTWSVCPEAITSPSHGGIRDLISPRTNTSAMRLDGPHQSGINPRLGASGTAAWQKPRRAIRSGNARNGHASTAASLWLRWLGIRPEDLQRIFRNIAARPVKHPPIESATEHSPSHQVRTLGRIGLAKTVVARIAGKCLAPLFAKPDFPSDSVPRYADRPVKITSVTSLIERTDTCCIYVPDVHCFSLANGAIVHNSHCADAWRTLAVSIRQPQREREKEQQRRQREYASPWS